MKTSKIIIIIPRPLKILWKILKVILLIGNILLVLPLLLLEGDMLTLSIFHPAAFVVGTLAIILIFQPLSMLIQTILSIDFLILTVYVGRNFKMFSQMKMRLALIAWVVIGASLFFFFHHELTFHYGKPHQQNFKQYSPPAR